MVQQRSEVPLDALRQLEIMQATKQPVTEGLWKDAFRIARQLGDVEKQNWLINNCIVTFQLPLEYPGALPRLQVLSSNALKNIAAFIMVECGDLVGLQNLIQNGGININTLGPEGTLLMVAARHSHKPVVNYLLTSCRADANIVFEGMTAAAIASHNDSLWQLIAPYDSYTQGELAKLAAQDAKQMPPVIPPIQQAASQYLFGVSVYNTGEHMPPSQFPTGSEESSSPKLNEQKLKEQQLVEEQARKQEAHVIHMNPKLDAMAAASAKLSTEVLSAAAGARPLSQLKTLLTPPRKKPPVSRTSIPASSPLTVEDIGKLAGDMKKNRISRLDAKRKLNAINQAYKALAEDDPAKQRFELSLASLKVQYEAYKPLKSSSSSASQASSRSGAALFSRTLSLIRVQKPTSSLPLTIQNADLMLAAFKSNLTVVIDKLLELIKKEQQKIRLGEDNLPHFKIMHEAASEGLKLTRTSIDSLSTQIKLSKSQERERQRLLKDYQQIRTQIQSLYKTTATALKKMGVEVNEEGDLESTPAGVRGGR